MGLGAMIDGLYQNPEEIQGLRSKSIRAGDTLFLPSLRGQRLANQLGEVEGGDVDIAAIAGRRKDAIDELKHYISDVADKGAETILEYPLPLFRAPPFRCSDWFSKFNEVCEPGFTISRAELDEHLAPLGGVLDDIVDASPNTKRWDPFPVICPGETCSA